MDTKINYTLVGVFVLVLGAALIAISFWLSAGRHQKIYHQYLVYMNEPVYGLSDQADVKYNGVQVGYVYRIRINHQNLKQVVLELRIEDGTPITETTTATLMAQGITGLTYIGLKTKTAEAPPLRAKKGEAYPVIPSSPSLLVELDEALRDVMENVKTLSDNISNVLDDQNTKSFATILQNTARVTDTLASKTNKIANTIDSTDTLMKNASAASKQLPETMQNFNQAVKSLQNMSHSIQETSQTINKTAKQSQTVIETTAQQGLPGMIELIQKLDHVTNNLESITSALRRNPGVIVRGKTPPTLGPGEK